MVRSIQFPLRTTARTVETADWAVVASRRVHWVLRKRYVGHHIEFVACCEDLPAGQRYEDLVYGCRKKSYSSGWKGRVVWARTQDTHYRERAAGDSVLNPLEAFLEDLGGQDGQEWVDKGYRNVVNEDHECFDYSVVYLDMKGSFVLALGHA